MPKQDEKKVETISVPKEQWDKVLDRLASLEGGVGDVSLDEPEFRTGRVRILDGKPVSKISNVIRTKKFENDGSEILECTATVVNDDGSTGDVTADYLKFVRECEQVTAKIVGIKDTPYDAKLPVGEPAKIEVAEVGDWKTQGTGRYVKNKVVLHHTEYTVELPDGRQVTLETLNL